MPIQDYAVNSYRANLHGSPPSSAAALLRAAAPGRGRGRFRNGDGEQWASLIARRRGTVGLFSRRPKGPGLAMFPARLAGYAPLRRRSLELRGRAPVCARAVHARLPGMVAELQSGWEMWLRFAMEVGAIGPAGLAELEQRGQKGLEELITLQASYHQASDPALRFLGLLQAALAAGRGHVADRWGAIPESPKRQ